MQVLGNAAVFVLVYAIFMIPTYVLPYMGSNSSVINAAGEAAGAGMNPAFWMHLTSLVVLVVITWFRANLIGKNALIIFPILATLFDLVPVISSIPFVPTVMHVLALIFGVTWATQQAQAPKTLRSSGAHRMWAVSKLVGNSVFGVSFGLPPHSTF